MVAFGDSYGGYSAYMQMLTFPDLYAAGAAWGGITDLESLLDETTPRYRQMIQQYFEDPEDRLEELRERSPVSKAENLSAPLCIVHGTNDQTLPVSQARSLRCALEEQGFDEGRDGDFEYYELEGEDHESVYGSNRYRLNQKLIGFFQRRIDLE